MSEETVQPPTMSEVLEAVRAHGKDPAARYAEQLAGDLAKGHRPDAIARFAPSRWHVVQGVYFTEIARAPVQIEAGA